MVQLKRTDYKQQLSEQDSLYKELIDKLKKGKVNRFGQSWISVSDIAQQYFCEKKVEMKFLYGEVETESKLFGSEAHDSLLGKSVEANREEIIQEIYSGKLVVPQEMLLLSKYRGHILAGRPDAIVFIHTSPPFLFEYKFSKSQIPYNSYHVQAKVYCKILERMGFNTRRLHYVISIIPPHLRKDEELFGKIFTIILNNGPKETSLKTEEANIFILKYRPRDAERVIDWTLDFWNDERKAIPSKNPNKCKKCEYFEKCISSIIKNSWIS